MSLTLDPAPKSVQAQSIQRRLARGVSGAPANLLTHALDLIKAEEDWLLRNQEAINERLDESFAAAERGDSYSPEEAREILAKRRAARDAHAA